MTGNARTGVKSSVPRERINIDYLVSRRPIHVNPSLCAECGGDCCKRYAGAAHPSDFGRSRASRLRNIRVALESGSWSVDWWEGNPGGCRGSGTAYYVRPAHVERRWPGSVRDPSWGGTCVFFQEGKGCALPLRQRPTGCRTLIPKDGRMCKHPYQDGKSDKYHAAVAWWPYRKDVERIVEEVDARGSERSMEKS